MNRILLSSALTGTACYIALEVAAPTLTIMDWQWWFAMEAIVIGFFVAFSEASA